MAKDLTRSFTHKTEITTEKPALPISTGMVSQERYNKALDSLEFHAKNSVLKDEQISQLRAILRPAVDAARERDKQKSKYVYENEMPTKCGACGKDLYMDSYDSNNSSLRFVECSCGLSFDEGEEPHDGIISMFELEHDQSLLAAGEILGIGGNYE